MKRLQVACALHQRLYDLNMLELSDIDKVVGTALTSVAAWEPFDEREKIALNYYMIAGSYRTQFTRIQGQDQEKVLALVNRSLEYTDKALQMLASSSLGKGSRQWADTNKRKVEYLMRRATIYKGKAAMDKAEADMRAAIDTLQKLMENVDEEEKVEGEEYDTDELRAEYQFDLGKLYASLASITMKQDDLHEAVYSLQRASESTKRDDPQWMPRFVMLQATLEAFMATMGAQKLGSNVAIKTKTEEVERLLASTKEEDQGGPQAHALYRLAEMHYQRYQDRHTVDDLLIAAEHLQKAVMKLGDDDHSHIFQCLSLESGLYHLLFDDDDDPKYLRRGLETCEKAVQLLPKAGPAVNTRGKAMLYNNMGYYLYYLADEEYDGDASMARSLVERAIQAGEAAAEILEKEDKEEENEDDDRRDEEYQNCLSSLAIWCKALNNYNSSADARVSIDDDN